MNVHAMRQLELVGRSGHALDNLSRRHVEVLDRLVQPADVAPLLLLPYFHAARVDHLGCIALGR